MPKDFANAQDLVAIQEIRDDTLVLKDGSLRRVLMVNGLNFALRSEAEQNIITAAYQNFLNTLDFSLQIIIHSRRVNIGKYLEKLAEYERSEPSPILRNQNSEYRAFVKGFVEKNAIMEKSFFVVVPWAAASLPTKRSVMRFIPFFNKNKDTEDTEKQETEEAFEESLEQMSQRVARITEGLAAMELEAVPLGTRELAELLYNFYNPESIERDDITLPEKTNPDGSNQKT